jgi:hypothetical protein
MNSKLSRRGFLMASAASQALLRAAPGKKPSAEPQANSVGNIPLQFRKASPPGQSEPGYPDFQTTKATLPKGFVKVPGALPLPCDIIFERDVPVKLRDGAVLYADIFRPAAAEKVPAVVCWSPYGKSAGDGRMDSFPNRGGVPLSSVSAMEKFEAPDPAYWCNHGYAVVNPDIRGALHSDGDIHFWGRFDALDARDLIEWLAAREWCQGKIGLAGNSWLAISQWYIAAEQPPHLAAIAPWEGNDDVYRDSLMRGGIPDLAFMDGIIGRMKGRNRVEDPPAMARQYPMMNEYWEDKIARVENIHIPAYVSATWTNSLHTHGTFNAFRRLASTEKWLRVHNSHEWPDLYSSASTEDLRKFFDRYLRGVKNGWESTPRVRLTVLDLGGHDVLYRPEKEFPLARTQYTKLYLDVAANALSPAPITKAAAARYNSEAPDGHVAFLYRFDRDTELTGYSKLHLWVEAPAADDMDLFVGIQKLDAGGQVAQVITSPANPVYTGPTGRIRVSHRRLDPARSTPWEPYLSHTVSEPLAPAQVVPVEISLWPASMLWHAGEQLRVVIASGAASSVGPAIPTINRGDHVIHAGGKYDSFLQVPLIPADKGTA